MRSILLLLWWLLVVPFVVPSVVLADGITFRMTVLFDRKAKAYLKTDGGTQNAARRLVSMMNEALVHSGIAQDEIQFALREVNDDLSYVGKGNIMDDLEWLMEAYLLPLASNDDYTEFKTLQEGYDTDFLVLITGASPKLDAAGCFTAGVSVSYQEEEGYGPGAGFSAIGVRDALKGTTFIHEIGHSLGAGHSDEHTPDMDPGPQSQMNPYSSGMYMTKSRGFSRNYCTVMSYETAEFNIHGVDFTVLPIFSSSKKNPYYGKPYGDARHDNVRAIRKTAKVIASHQVLDEDLPFSSISELESEGNSEGIPSWLGMSVPAPKPEDEGVTAQEGDVVRPDWLGPAPEPEDEGVTAQEGDVVRPDWLKEKRQEDTSLDAAPKEGGQLAMEAGSETAATSAASAPPSQDASSDDAYLMVLLLLALVVMLASAFALLRLFSVLRKTPKVLGAVVIYGAEMRLQNGQVLQKSFRVSPGDCLRISIGRKPDNDWMIIDDSISGYHAQLMYEQGQLRIVDCHSKNGLIVNNAVVPAGSTQSLAVGQVILLGRVSLQLTILS